MLQPRLVFQCPAENPPGTIANKAENRFIFDLVEKHLGGRGKLDGVWLGASDEEKESDWRWIDASRFAFTNWCRNPKQPNNAGGDERYLWMWPLPESHIVAGRIRGDFSTSVHLLHAVIDRLQAADKSISVGPFVPHRNKPRGLEGSGGAAPRY